MGSSDETRPKPQQPPADVTYIVAVFKDGRWTDVLTTRDQGKAQGLKDPIGDKARITEIAGKRR